MIDEATGRAFARFARDNSLHENLQTLSLYLTRWGRPRQVRTDKSKLFAGSSCANLQDQGAGGQIRRALSELDIRWAAANSPRDLGGAASFFASAVSGLPGELRSARARGLKDAADYLENTFLRRWNSGIVCDEKDHHFPLLPGHDLDSVLGQVEFRTVSSQGFVRFHRRLYWLPSAAAQHLTGEQIRIEARANGKVLARWRGSTIDLEQVPAEDFPAEAPKREPREPFQRRRNGRAANPGWMKGFFETPVAPIWRHFK